MVKHLIEQLDHLEEMLDDFGDTSGFEKPPLHKELLENLWNEFGGEGSDDEVFAFVAQAEEAGFNEEEIRDFLSNYFGDADDNTLNYWVGLEDDEDEEFNESIDDFGTVDDFEDPGNSEQDLINLWDEFSGGGPGGPGQVEDEQIVYDFVRAAKLAGFRKGIVRDLLRSIFDDVDDNTLNSWLHYFTNTN